MFADYGNDARTARRSALRNLCRWPRDLYLETPRHVDLKMRISYARSIFNRVQDSLPTLPRIPELSTPLRRRGDLRQVWVVFSLFFSQRTFSQTQVTLNNRWIIDKRIRSFVHRQDTVVA